jgi:diguanylate cyclase (GGDEF)-like protein
VNDKLVKAADLHDRDQIKIGRTILKFIAGDNVEASYHEEIYRLMTVDGLTQIANRRAFDEALQREISRAQRYERPMSLLLFDVDHFKQTNDRWGHLAGDMVLRELAATVAPQLRRQDTVARVGGEEFAVIAPEVDLAGARVLAEKIRKLVAAAEFRFERDRVPTTVSIGTAELGAGDGPQDLYARADAALYEAKQGGRNRVA